MDEVLELRGARDRGVFRHCRWLGIPGGEVFGAKGAECPMRKTGAQLVARGGPVFWFRAACTATAALQQQVPRAHHRRVPGTQF